MNPLIALTVFAALRKEAGEGLYMPEGRTALVEPSDADFIAEALEWAMQTPAARNEAFNLNNGDLLSRHQVFPILARCMHMNLGPPRRYSLTEEISRLGRLWPDMVKKYRLNAPSDLKELFGNSLQIAGQWTNDTPPERVLGSGFSSNIKIRQAGFQTCVDNRVMIEKHILRMQELRMIPA